MFLEQIERRLSSLKDKMESRTTKAKKTATAVKAATKKTAVRTASAAVAAGAKTIGIQVEPGLYARIQKFKEARKITSMKKAVIALCERALDNLKIY